MEARPATGAEFDAGLVGELRHALVAATLRLTEPPGPITILYSGGLDSSVLAWILRARPRTQLLTIGREGSQDLVAAEATSEELGLPWTGHRLEEQQIRDAGPRWASALGSVREPERSVQLAFALAFEAAGSRRLVLGQGADELFWGYARVRSAPVEEAGRLAEQALEKLLAQDLPLTGRLASATGHELLLPYLDKEVRDCVAAFPLGAHHDRIAGKPMLRQVARALGVPLSACERPKRAIQYGTGIGQALRAFPAGRQESAK
ncbi:MAG: asparagine synthase-related protein [Thermoplasmata archaeon]|nr:asparagine synthase-related protein [Thermoplasmata archaeon]